MKDRLLLYVMRFARYLGYQEQRVLFYAETSRVLKGEVAPKDKIFYIMRANNTGKRYMVWILLPTGMTDANKTDVYERLLTKIVKTYGL